MRVRQSDLKMWQKCALIYKHTYLDQLPREQSGSLTFGTIIHDCVLYLEEQQNLDAALARFKRMWADPVAALGPEYHIEYYVRGTNWKKFLESGQRILRDWWSIISWDTELVIAREHSFEVPIGDGHTLFGTVDKVVIAYRAAINSFVVKIVDYKTDKKTPTYDYLAEDLQFSSYAYASTQREFWTAIGGDDAWRKYLDLPRYGEWVQLTGPKRMDAGERTQRHYNRIELAANAIADSVAMRIFVPTISGESCRYCEFRKPCGLPQLDDDGNEVVTSGP